MRQHDRLVSDHFSSLLTEIDNYQEVMIQKFGMSDTQNYLHYLHTL